MTAHTLDFTPDGTVSGLHTDRTDLSALGPMKVRRASWIDFNEHSQKWEVRWSPHADDPVFTHESREVCLDWEREQLQSEKYHEELSEDTDY